MSVLPILPIQHPLLRRVCSRVTAVSPSVRKLMEDLEETMLAANGVGLAAPQVGKPLRVMVVRREGEALALANPEIVRSSGMAIEEEGCLSMPLYYGPVQRPAEVTVRALNRRGKQVRYRAAGLFARALQHEIDHLNGIVFKDKLAEGAALRFARPQGAEAAEPAAG